LGKFAKKWFKSPLIIWGLRGVKVELAFLNRRIKPKPPTTPGPPKWEVLKKVQINPLKPQELPPNNTLILVIRNGTFPQI